MNAAYTYPLDLDTLNAAFASRYSDSKLAPFQAALAKRAMAPVDILCVGDSVTEGLYASKYAQRWVRRLAGSLRGRFPVSGVTGGDGYVPIWVTNGTYTDYPVTIGGTMATSASYGLGLRARQMGGSGASVTLTFTGTAFDFFYVKYSGGGSFTVKVDGGTAVQVNTTNATTIGGQRYSVTGLTAGSHTVVVNWVSGICFFEGFMLYNGDENAGVRVWDSGHSSYRAGNFDGTSNPHWIDAVSAIQPALVVLEFGINDWEQNITPAAFQTSLQAIISNVRALCTTPPLFALFKCWVANVGGTPTYKWTDYTAIMDQIAAGDDHVVVFDAWERLTQGSATAVRGPAPWLDGDTIHPNDAGHGFIADCLTDFLTPH